MPDNPTWEGRSRGNRLGYRIFVWLLKTGGLGPAYFLLFFVALYYRWFVPAATRPLRFLYQQRLHFDKKQTRQLIRRNIIVFGQTLIDKIAILADIPTGLTFTHEGIENIEDLVSKGKGGILLSAHLGNWEVAGHLLKRVNTPINIVMYDGEQAQMKQYMDQFESKRSFNVIFIKEDLSHIYEISAALARNELICLHGDRYRPGQRILPHSFLGSQAMFPAGPFILASKLKAPVCFVFAFKESNFHYHFYAEPAKIYEGRGTIGIESMLDDYTVLVEKKLHQYPHQWFNYYDFWKA
ncbi:MAG: lipid A biosynthesis acyltransferase [Bacteroidetes bacterium]|nr:lipid A biosynthesis acyltransferase [Bacteroidota bacterium]